MSRIDTLPTIAERVAAGAAWLDEHEPGWVDRIDLGRLNIRRCADCIGGQLGGWWSKFAARYDDEPGFNIYRLGLDTLDLEEYPPLTAAWRDLITARRAAS